MPLSTFDLLLLVGGQIPSNMTVLNKRMSSSCTVVFVLMQHRSWHIYTTSHDVISIVPRPEDGVHKNETAKNYDGKRNLPAMAEG